MTRALRIGVDVREWMPGTSTGIARIVTNLVRWASAHTAHELVVFGNQHTEIRVEAANVSARIAPEARSLVWDQVQLPRMLAATSVDVFLSPYYKGPLRAPCPVVVTTNDLIELRYPDTSSVLKRGLLPFWMKRVLGRAAMIMTLSEFSRRDIVDTLGVDPARIRVIPLGLEDAFRVPPGEQTVAAATSTYEVPQRSVLYIGRCSPHKNVGTLIEAWGRLPDDLRAAHPLVLAGSDSERFRAAAAGRSGVLVAGFIGDGDLAGLYGSAAVFCFPSLYEGFGLPPLEAMGCGVPVIASNAASMPEVLGDAALLVDPTDPAAWGAALQRILNDPAAGADLRRKGIERAAAFTPERAAHAIVRVLEAAAAGGGR